ncbi:MAG: hypothetical protein ACP5L3_07670 [Caldisericum sp.]|uniref:hypothetical protein n=1 Tax=Caldisericum sp. TaxID=2499687 RepID=UPI003D13A577
MPKIKGVAVLGQVKFIKKNYKNVLDNVISALPAESAQNFDEKEGRFSDEITQS